MSSEISYCNYVVFFTEESRKPSSLVNDGFAHATDFTSKVDNFGATDIVGKKDEHSPESSIEIRERIRIAHFMKPIVLLSSFYEEEAF
jgi:hypothetical protein